MALVKAKFDVAGKGSLPVHFNPSEYSLRTVPGTPAASSAEDIDLPLRSIGKSDYEELEFTLYFDTYTLVSDGSMTAIPAMTTTREDVRAYTEEIAALARRQDGTPMVSFIWGSLNFAGTVESVDQKFTMFLDDGKPVRAELRVKMRSCAIEPRDFGMRTRGALRLSDDNWKAAAAATVAAGKLRDVLNQFV